MSETNATDFVGSHFKEAIKSHLVYDGSNRVTHHYVAISTAKDNEACMVTRYTYNGATTNVVGMTEEIAAWLTIWDI